MDKLINKIGLGTATFIDNYGFKYNKPNPDIINQSIIEGIKIIDTSPEYGNSLKLISKYLSQNKKQDLEIISKTNYKKARDNFKKNKFLFLDSLNKEFLGLNDSNLNTLLWHSITKDELVNKVTDMMASRILESKIIKKLGCSTYGSEAAIIAYEKKWCTDIQIEFSILNQNSLRCLESHVKVKEKRIMLRSILCKGLLTKEWELKKNYLPRKVINTLKKIELISQSHDCSITDLAIFFALNQNFSDIVLIGIANTYELSHLIKTLNKILKLPDFIYNELKDLDCSSFDCVHPERW